MNSPRYVLRVSVRTLGKAPINGLEVEPNVVVGAIKVTVTQRGRFLVLHAGEFESEQQAEAFIPKIKGGLWNLAIEHNIAFSPTFVRRDITHPEDPYAAGRNLSRSLGGNAEEPIAPVHGLTEEEGWVVYRADETIKFLGMGEASAYVSTAWEGVAKTLTEGIERVRPTADGMDADLSTAIDLYLSSFYESSTRARFLTLVMALEVLAPVIPKHAAAVQLLGELQRTIDVRLADEADIEARDALEALRREIEFRKETSIRRRIRRLIQDEAPLEVDQREAFAKTVVAAYDLRSAVVHKGGIDPEALGIANATALTAVKMLLRVRLGLIDTSLNLYATE